MLEKKAKAERLEESTFSTADESLGNAPTSQLNKETLRHKAWDRSARYRGSPIGNG